MTETNAPLKTWEHDNTSLRDNPPSSHSIFYFNKPIMFRLLQCKLFAHYDWLVVVLGCGFVSAPTGQGPQYFKVNHSTSASCSRLKEEEFISSIDLFKVCAAVICNLYGGIFSFLTGK